MGSMFDFKAAPLPLGASGASGYVADHCLRAGVNMHDLHDLLAAALHLSERLGLQREGSRELHGHPSRAVILWDLIHLRRATHRLGCQLMGWSGRAPVSSASEGG